MPAGSGRHHAEEDRQPRRPRSSDAAISNLALLLYSKALEELHDHRERLLARRLGIIWRESFVTDDKTYCVYVADSEDIILEHARCAGIPADRISRVAQVLDPSWGE